MHSRARRARGMPARNQTALRIRLLRCSQDEDDDASAIREEGGRGCICSPAEGGVAAAELVRRMAAPSVVGSSPHRLTPGIVAAGAVAPVGRALPLRALAPTTEATSDHRRPRPAHGGAAPHAGRLSESYRIGYRRGRDLVATRLGLIGYRNDVTERRASCEAYLRGFGTRRQAPASSNESLGINPSRIVSTPAASCSLSAALRTRLLSMSPAVQLIEPSDLASVRLQVAWRRVGRRAELSDLSSAATGSMHRRKRRCERFASARVGARPRRWRGRGQRVAGRHARIGVRPARRHRPATATGAQRNVAGPWAVHSAGTSRCVARCGSSSTCSAATP